MIKIKIETVEKIKNFIKVVNSFHSDVDVKKDHYILDAKSIMGIYSLDLSTPVFVSINTNDMTEEASFKEAMKQFEFREGE